MHTSTLSQTLSCSSFNVLENIFNNETYYIKSLNVQGEKGEMMKNRRENMNFWYSCSWVIISSRLPLLQYGHIQRIDSGKREKEATLTESSICKMSHLQNQDSSPEVLLGLETKVLTALSSGHIFILNA